MQAGFTPFTEPEVVAAYLQPVLERLAMAFASACTSSRALFDARDWSHDAALSAYLIRKEVLESIRDEGIQIEEEDLEVERKALCGMLLKMPLVQLKIRKSKDGEIPPAGSDQSLAFYNWNLIVFPQGDEDKAIPLHLMLLWNDNSKGELETLLLVCVEGSTWRWRIPVFERISMSYGSAFQAGAATTSGAGAPVPSYVETFDEANEDVPMNLIDNSISEEQKDSEQTQAEDTEEARQKKKKA